MDFNITEEIKMTSGCDNLSSFHCNKTENEILNDKAKKSTTGVVDEKKQN